MSIVQYLRPKLWTNPPPQDWTNNELAEFYRVEASLIRVGVQVETGRGVTDEGHPWFVFCRADTGEVILHLARLDGSYLVVSPTFGSVARGPDFRSLVQRVIGSFQASIPPARGGNVYTHPSAALIALVSICYFVLHNKEVVAGETKAPDSTRPPAKAAAELAPAMDGKTFELSESQMATIVAAIGVTLSDSVNVGAATLDSTPTDHLYSLSGSTAPAPSDFSDSSNAGGAAQWAHYQARSLDELAYTGSETDHQAPSILPLDVGKSASIVEHLAPKILSVAGFEQATDALYEANPSESDSLLLAPTHHLLQSAVSTGAQLANISVVQDLAPVASTTNFNPPAELAASFAGQEIIAVLGDSLQAHYVVNPSHADKDFVLDLTGGQTVHGASALASGRPVDHAAPEAAPQSTNSPPTPSASGASGVQTAGAGDATGPVAWSGFSSLNAENIAATNQIIFFEHAHPDFQVMDSGKEVIIYDPDLIAVNHSAADRETFSFPDGSSIVLVGLAPTHHVAPTG